MQQQKKGEEGRKAFLAAAEVKVKVVLPQNLNVLISSQAPFLQEKKKKLLIHTVSTLLFVCVCVTPTKISLTKTHTSGFGLPLMSQPQ